MAFSEQRESQVLAMSFFGFTGHKGSPGPLSAAGFFHFQKFLS
jgi:hypothetical protein